MASPIADFVVSLGTDGRVQSQGTLSKVLAKDDKLAEELAEESEEIKKAENEVDHVDPDDEAAPPKADGKLVVAEEISEGHISWQACECRCFAPLVLLQVCSLRMISADVPHEHGRRPFVPVLGCCRRVLVDVRAARRRRDVVARLLGAAV